MKNERGKSGLTKALYEADGSIREFEAVVLLCEKIEEQYAVVLNETAFFPEGGGQPADGGTIADVQVLDVQTDDQGRILHYIGKELSTGQKVLCKLDYETRFRRMQNHGAEHILSGLIHSMYGYENVGFHMGKDEVRFDVDGELTKEQIKEIERRANEAVYANVPITISFLEKDEVKNLEYRSKLELTEDVRLVTIEGYDACACCAPHLSRTGQIGIIKIINAIPHRQGTRITMIAGLDAYEDYGMLHDDNARIMAIVSAKREETAKLTKELSERYQKSKEEVIALKKELSGLVTAIVVEGLKKKEEFDEAPEVIFTDVLDQVGLRNLINECLLVKKCVIAGFLGDDRVGYRYIIGSSSTIDAKEVAKRLHEQFPGKGGGSDRMVQGSVQGHREEIKNWLISK